MTERGNGRFRALLVDAGGTLFPDALPEAPGVREVRLRRLAALLPELERDDVARLLDELRDRMHERSSEVEQRTDADVAEVLESARPGLGGRASEVRRTLGRATGHEHPPFAGHRELLETAGELGLRRVLVSNTNWVSDEDWQEWRLASLGIDGLLDGIVTSYSLGRRKPDRAMFDRATALAGCPPHACVFMGDREDKDVEPALALGMTVIIVAIQSPPTATRAQHQVTSLRAATEALRTLQSPLTNP
ncbi:MAG TPA: HAD family hydrolase [Candidatus Dormibacteraeota bacterium]